MAALTLTIPTRTGTASPGAAVAASDTIDAKTLGARGVFLEILNANAGTDNVTISDASQTPSGAPAASNAPSIPTGQNRVFAISPSQADSVTGVTITHSVTSNVSYKMYSRD